MRRARLYVALVAILLAACATAPTAKSPEQRVLEAVKLADGIYLDTMAAAGEAHRAKVLSDADFAAILAVGEDVRAARQVALASLIAYLSATDSAADPAQVDADLDVLKSDRLRLEKWAAHQVIAKYIAKRQERHHATD